MVKPATSSWRVRLFGYVWAPVLSLGATYAFAGNSQGGTFPRDEAGGTGGISVDKDGRHWSALVSGTPHVTQTGPTSFRIDLPNGYTLVVPSGNTNRDRFLTLWWKLHDPTHGYFSPVDMPFHAAETLIVEAPDYGHLTTSETVSYWAWLEAEFGRFSGEFSLLHYVYDRMETYAIPKVQFGTDAYNASSPATFAPEEDLPSAYPVQFNAGVRPGQDPIASELKNAYGSQIYGMHWLIDTANWYGFGTGQDPVYINTFERGPMESVFLAIPHPEVDELRYGAERQGFLSLYSIDPSGYKRQWRYTNAPDADARMVQVAYWANEYAKAAGNGGALSDLDGKASRMGDFLRYAMFDKYFKAIGCTSPDCPAGNDYSSAHHLLGWYYSWGGAHPADYGQWSWRIGGSHVHFGYQNPLAAFALSQDQDLRPRTPNGGRDWQQSLTRQLEFYRWLQSAEGGIAGGATNSWNGRYDQPPAGQATFYGMAFDPNPVYHNPNSNNWFGFQAWSMERLCEYYLASGDTTIEPMLDRWAAWVTQSVQLTSDGGYKLPSTLSWSGQPATWRPQNPQANTGLHVAIVDYAEDVGVAGSLAKALLFYAKGTAQHRGRGATAASQLASELIARTWDHYQDAKGVTASEVRLDYTHFNDAVYVPANFRGSLPSGAALDGQATFLSLRPQYLTDPDFPKVQAYLNGGPAPVFTYHRFWAEVDAAVAFATAERLGH